MKLSILWLETASGNEALIAVHRAGCADIARTIRRRGGWSEDVEGIDGVIDSLLENYSEHTREHIASWIGIRGMVDVLPCAKA